VAVILQPQRGLTTGFQKGLTAKSLRNSFLNNANKVAENVFFTATTVTPVASPNVTENLYPANPVPASFDPDSINYTLGAKVRFSQAGFITGVRFYKRSGDAQLYHGISIWDQATGLELVRGTIINETASGWQQGLFAQPLAVVANKTYTVTYQQNGGGYAILVSAFTSALVSGSITGLADGTDGNNGVFFQAAGPTDIPTFPNGTFNASSYFITPIFVSGTPTKNLIFGINETQNTLTSTQTSSKSLTFGEVESLDRLTATEISSKSITGSFNEGKDTLAASSNAGSGITKDISFGINENQNRYSQAITEAIPIGFDLKEGRDFTGTAIVPLITDLVGADWNSGTATGSALSEVQVIGVNLQYVTQFLANGVTMPVENLGTASPTVILPAAGGSYTITMVGLGSTGILITSTKSLVIAVNESKDTLTLGVAKNTALTGGFVESKDTLTMNAAGTSVRNLTFGINESRDVLSVQTTASRSIAASFVEGPDKLTAAATSTKSLTFGEVEGKDILANSPTRSKNLTFGETENLDRLTANTASSKNLTGSFVENPDRLADATTSAKSITFGINESPDRLTLNTASTKNLVFGETENRDTLSASTSAVVFKNLTFGINESRDVLTATTATLLTKNLTFALNESRDVLSAQSISSKSLTIGEVENPNRLTANTTSSKSLTFGEVENPDRLTDATTSVKNLTFAEVESKDALNAAVTQSKNLAFGEVENRDALTWTTGAVVFKSITFGVNESPDRLTLNTASAKNLTGSFVENPDRLIWIGGLTKPLGYIGAENRDALTWTTSALKSLVYVGVVGQDRLNATVLTGVATLDPINYGAVLGGSFLVITGTNLIGVTSALFAGVGVLGFTEIDSTHLQIILPYGSTLTGSFTVATAVGIAIGGTVTRTESPVLGPSGNDGGPPRAKKPKRKYAPLVFTPLPEIPTEILVERKGKAKEIAVQNEEGTARDIAEILEMLDALEVTDLDF
jgi:Domain of unknown function (DUF4082)